MFSKILAASATALMAAQANDAKVKICLDRDCDGLLCYDHQVPFNGCLDLELAGIAFRCTPSGDGVVVDVVLDTKCSGTPILSDKFAANECHSIGIPDTPITISVELEECVNGTTSLALH